MTDITVGLVASAAALNGSTTLAATVGATTDGSPAYPTLTGDSIVVCGGAGTHIPTGVTDSKGNAYTQIGGSAASPASWAFVAQNATALKAAGPGFTADTITATYSVNTDHKQMVVISSPSILSAAAVDAAGTANAAGTGGAGSGTPPSVATAALGAARELVIGVLVNANAAGVPAWATGWAPAATAHTGSDPYCSVAVRPLYSASGATVTAAADFAVSGSWNLTTIALKATTPALKSYVGASVFNGSYPGLSRVAGEAQFDSNIGRSPCAQRVGAFYYGEDEWGTAAHDSQDTVSQWNLGVSPLVCIKPKRDLSGGTTASLNSMVTFLTYLKNNGVRAKIALWNEMNFGGGHGPFGDGTTKNNPGPWVAPVTGTEAASHYHQYCQYYSPAIIASGLPVSYKPTVGASPQAAVDFFPGRALVNSMEPDLYADNFFASPGANNLEQMDELARGTLAGNLFSVPLDLGMGELGGSSGKNPPANEVAAFLANTNPSLVIAGVHPYPSILSRWLTRLADGQPSGWIIWFDGTGGQNNFNASTDASVTAAFVAIYDQVSIDAASAGPPVITTTTLPGGQVGVPYEAQVGVTSGAPPYTWAVTAGSLPAGLALDASTGVISGNPTQAG